MPITLKADKTWTDEHNNIHTNAYAVVDVVQNDKKSQECKIKVDAYKDSSTYTASLSDSTILPCCSRQINVTGTDWTTYFATSVLDDTGKTCFSQAELYILTLSDYADWEAV